MGREPLCGNRDRRSFAPHDRRSHACESGTAGRRPECIQGWWPNDRPANDPPVLVSGAATQSWRVGDEELLKVRGVPIPLFGIWGILTCFRLEIPSPSSAPDNACRQIETNLAESLPRNRRREACATFETVRLFRSTLPLHYTERRLVKQRCPEPDRRARRNR